MRVKELICTRHYYSLELMLLTQTFSKDFSHFSTLTEIPNRLKSFTYNSTSISTLPAKKKLYMCDQNNVKDSFSSLKLVQVKMNSNQFGSCFSIFNLFNPKISLVTLLTECHTFLMMLVQRIWRIWIY